MYTQTLTLSSVGQITIPRSIRKLLGLEKGARFDVTVDQKTNTITLKKQKTIDEVVAELDKLREGFPEPDPRTRYMTVGEMSLEQAKHIKGDTWV